MEFKILSNIFDNLPEMDINGELFKPVFEYGSHTDLLKFLRMKDTGIQKNVYPLIWLETPTTFTSKLNTIESDLTLVVATISNAELTNRERTELTFITTLNPLVDTIIKEINNNFGTRVVLGTIETEKYFKYISDNKNIATDIWDATKLKFKMNFNKDCLIK